MSDIERYLRYCSCFVFHCSFIYRGLDEANHRLFVGTRDPPKLMVFDTNSGKVISILDIAKDPDDISYDAVKKQIYVSCGERSINIFQQQQQPHQPILLLSIDLVACYYVMVNGISNQKKRK